MYLAENGSQPPCKSLTVRSTALSRDVAPYQKVGRCERTGSKVQRRRLVNQDNKSTGPVIVQIQAGEVGMSWSLARLGGQPPRTKPVQFTYTRLYRVTLGISPANDSMGRLINLARVKTQKRCGDARAATEFPRLSAPVCPRAAREGECYFEHDKNSLNVVPGGVDDETANYTVSPFLGMG